MDNIRLELNEHGDGAFYVLEKDQIVGKMLVGIGKGVMNAYHTEALIEGQGYAKKLLIAMVSYAREHQMKVKPYCPYVHAQFRRYPDQYADVWNRDDDEDKSP